MNPFSSHIANETLIDLADGRLTPAQHAQTQAHLETCQRCTTELSSIQRVLAIMNSDKSIDAPPFAIARVLSLFKPLAVAKPERRSLLALLRFDSAASLTPAMGMRSGQSTGRQLLFTIQEYDIDLRIEPTGDDWIVSGQVLGTTSSGQVELIGVEQRWQSELNELGEFGFSPAPAGEYQLIVALPDEDISIPPLTLGK